jgi:hypothetical protein
MFAQAFEHINCHTTTACQLKPQLMAGFTAQLSRHGCSTPWLHVCRPGAYQTSPKWSSSSHATASQHREAASKKVAELLGTATAAIASVAVAGVQPAGKSSSKAAEVPVLTPPSIPAKHQSYGYVVQLLLLRMAVLFCICCSWQWHPSRPGIVKHRASNAPNVSCSMHSAFASRLLGCAYLIPSSYIMPFMWGMMW